MSDTMVEGYEDAFPCPTCGSTELIQHYTASEDVVVNDSGEFERFDPRGLRTNEEVWCPVCDDIVWSGEVTQ